VLQNGASNGWPWRSVVVTGATGFIGSHLALLLAKSGVSVKAVGRRRCVPARLLHPNIDYCRGDIRDNVFLHSIVNGHDAVFHLAAHCDLGRSRRFVETNVLGSKNLKAACEAAGVRLVMVSSIAALSEEGTRAASKVGIDTYEGSKSAAEEDLRNSSRNLDFVLVRVRAVFGPGDNNLLPRLEKLARSGFLIRFGNKEVKVDLTHVSDAVRGIALAGANGRSRETYNIVDGRPVGIWETLRSFLEVKARRRLRVIMVPTSLARSFVSSVCSLHTVLRLRPPIDDYSLRLLTRERLIVRDRRLDEIGYKPETEIEDGLRELLGDAINPADEGQQTISCKVSHFSTGTVVAHGRLADGLGSGLSEFCSQFALIEHPNRGLVLFDTGYARRYLKVIERLECLPFRKAILLDPLTVVSARERLREIDVRSEDIATVIISHFHPDHIAGLSDFPNARFVATRSAWEHVRSKKGFFATRRAFIPDLLPRDFEDRLYLIERFDGPSLGAFPGTWDLFGDGTIRILDLSGHAVGMCGAIVLNDSREPLVLAADAAYTAAGLQEERLPHLITALFTHSRQQQKRTLRRLKSLASQLNAPVVLSHCASPVVPPRDSVDG